MAAIPLPSWLSRRLGSGGDQPWCRMALATDVSLEMAVMNVARQLRGAGQADLALVFASASYASDLPRLLPLLQERLQARHWLGCLAGGVIGTAPQEPTRELEGEAGLSVTLLRLPGARLHPFAIEPQQLPDLDGPAAPWLALLGPAERAEELAGSRSMLLLVDPGFTGINDLISGLDYACAQATKVGGIACPHSASGDSLLFGNRVRGGAVGCLIDGGWTLDPVVAQGCRPIGPVFEVEEAQRNVVLQLSRDDRRSTPVAALQAILTGLTPEERELVKHSLFLGVGRDSFRLETDGDAGAPTFLVRNLIGVDPRNGAVAVAERVRVGQQVQFQLRDGEASRQELQSLLERQRQRPAEPLAALLFACLGRGQGLYGRPDGDVTVAREVFGPLPVAGAFCNGEIGPVAGSTHLHGYTASWAFLVPTDAASADAA
ncbi:MAG: FIST C-terminal domain-containing protein [Cyanobium sp. Prado107]|jgi:small ligand-binding sensory domain FIST|nr:FIST C-terminal domain-containing protein [Cyanobium sp. Prado107]